MQKRGSPFTDLSMLSMIDNSSSFLHKNPNDIDDAYQDQEDLDEQIIELDKCFVADST